MSIPPFKKTSEHIIWGYQIAKYLKNEKNDIIVHCHTGYSGWKIVSIKTNFVFTAHNWYPWLRNLSYGAKNPASVLLRGLDDFLTLYVAKRAKVNIAVGSTLAYGMMKRGIPSHRIRVILNGVNICRFNPKITEDEKSYLRDKYGLPRDKILLLFVGGLRREKGIDLLIWALHKLIQREKNVFLTIVGAGYQRNYLETIVNKLHLNPYIKFLGSIPESDLPRLYVSSDVFVLPSYLEGMPLVALEAMASGIPIIITDIFGKDLITDNIEGLLVPAKDINALSEAMYKLVTDSELRKKMGMAARKKAEKLSWKENAKKLFSIYQSLLDHD
jgi:glycosyltransferase involved in cell wall biosynthesis